MSAGELDVKPLFTAASLMGSFVLQAQRPPIVCSPQRVNTLQGGGLPFPIRPHSDPDSVHSQSICCEFGSHYAAWQVKREEEGGLLNA